MRYLFLGDLHGNRPAVQALDRQLPAIHADEIWFLGDAVGKGPDNCFTCDWVRSHCDHFVGGNWDFGIGEKQFPADGYYWRQLGEERLAWLGSLPHEAEIIISGLRLRLVHGRPMTPLLKADNTEAELSTLLQANGRRYDGCIFADSHRPFFRTLDHSYVMNTGSVGNSMGMPRAHALLVEGDSKPGMLMATIISIPYDNEAARAAAEADPDLPFRDAYIREITTGIYSR